MSGPGYSRWPRQHIAHSCTRAGPPRLSDDQSLSRLLLLDPEAQPGCPLEIPSMIGVPHVPHRRESRFRASAIASILTSRDRLGCATRPQTAMTRTNERPHECSGASTLTHDTISSRKTGRDSLILSAEFPSIGPVECLFADWWAFRGGELDRAGLQARLNPIARELQGILEQGRSCADSKAATFCVNLLAVYPALWLFAAVEGVEPTNNHAERILRLGVLWRKNAFGCHSAAGCRFVERILTVVQTLRLQKRPVLEYLHRAIVAHRAGLPAPQLLGPAGD
ncbi:MAG: transposase [Isosphaeraceae bacterium]